MSSRRRRGRRGEKRAQADIPYCTAISIVVCRGPAIARPRETGRMNTPEKPMVPAASATGDLDEQALFYHRYPRPGKLEIQATKPLGNQRDLALAYSPGVAAPCLAIRDDPALAADYTGRANLVARHLQRHRRARPRQHRPARLQAGDGGQGRPVQEVRRHRRLRHRDRRAGHRAHGRRSSRRWSRPSAASTSRTSRRRSASRSRSSCASA